jgi:hypothetical protein
MKDACILYNVIQVFLQSKVTRLERGGLSSLLKLQITLAQSCKNISACLCNIQIFQLLEGKIIQWGVGHDNYFFGLNYIENNKSLSCARLGK